MTPPFTISTVKLDRPEQVQAVVDQADEEDAEGGPPDRAAAPEEARAADHRRADHVEEDALAEDRRARLEPRGVEHGGEAGAGPAGDVGAGGARAPRERRETRAVRALPPTA